MIVSNVMFDNRRQHGTKERRNREGGECELRPCAVDDHSFLCP